MHANKAIEKAQEKLREMRNQGEQVERLDPIEKANKNPTSLRLAINAKCYDCVGRDADQNWRKRVEHCEIEECPLWSVRRKPKGE